jgi:hypothetical protein
MYVSVQSWHSQRFHQCTHMNNPKATFGRSRTSRNDTNGEILSADTFPLLIEVGAPPPGACLAPSLFPASTGDSSYLTRLMRSQPYLVK